MHDDKTGASKSAAKRAAGEIRDLAQGLVDGRDDGWRSVIDDDTLIDAIELGRRLSKNARRRQISRVAKLLRAHPRLVEALQVRDTALEAELQRNRQRQRTIEGLRRDFLAGDDDTERQLRRQTDQSGWRDLVALRSDYHAAQADALRKTAFRALFRRLDALLPSR